MTRFRSTGWFPQPHSAWRRAVVALIVIVATGMLSVATTLAASARPANRSGGLPPTRAGAVDQNQEPAARLTADNARTEAPIEITAVTPWVDSEGEFQIRFRTSSTVPPDAELTYTIHQPLRAGTKAALRDSVAAIIEGGQPGRVLQAPRTAALSEFGTSDGGSLLSIPVRSRSSADRSRAFLPGSGIHPISIVVTAPDGPELWSTIVFLNHLPRNADPSANKVDPITVSLVMPVRTGPVLSGSRPEFDIADRSELDSLVNILQGAPAAPLKVLLRGDVIAGLLASDDTWARDMLASLEQAFAPGTDDAGANAPGTSGGSTTSSPTTTTTSTAAGAPATTGTAATTTTAPSTTAPTTAPTEHRASGEPSTGPELVAAPFVASDTEGIVRAGGSDALKDQISLGRSLASELSGRPIVSSTWMLDEYLGPRAAALVESLGFPDAIVASSQLSAGDERDARTNSRAPSRLNGTTSMRVTGYDNELSAMLTDGSTPAVNRSHQALTELVADWFDLDVGHTGRSGAESSAGRGAAAVIIIPPTADPVAVAALGSALGGSGPLRSPEPGSVLPPIPDGHDPEVGAGRPVSLKAPPVTDGVASVLRMFNDSGRKIAAFRSAAPAESLIETWRLRNAASLSARLSSEQAVTIHSSIDEQISGLISSITPPAARRIVLGARDTTIPLRFRNELPYEVTLALHARSPRVDVEGGESTRIRLEPGDNVVELPIVVRAPGESLLRVRITTPDDVLTIATVDLPVRSTAISGVGAALSAISILFLILWWGRTFARRRRENARDATTHPSTPAPTDS